MQSAKQAVRIWNERKDTYTSPDGQLYSIVYSLHPTINQKDRPLNVYRIAGEQTMDVAGTTLGYSQITVREDYAVTNPMTKNVSSTGAHEIGHTLGMSHEEKGIMSITQDDDRTNEVSQDNIAKMISSNVGIDIKLNLFEKIQDFFSKLFN